MARLAAAKGAEFDRLFLEGHDQASRRRPDHGEGAVLAARRGQESEIFAFASDVDADQRMEIDRMGAMLERSKELQK